MKKFVWLVAAGILVVGLAGCGSSSSSGTTPTVASLSDLPKATGKMATTSASVSTVKSSFFKAATTGLNISSTTAADFDAGSSRGACETFDVLRQGVQSAAQADMILCFISYMNSLDTFSGLVDQHGDPINIYDGAWHIFNMNFTNVPEDDDPPTRVKMQIVKTGGSITSFEMFMCDGTGEDMYQREYVKQTISGNDLDMTGKGLHSSPEGPGRHSVVVDGELNASNVYTSKEIATHDRNVFNELPNWQAYTLIQQPGIFNASGYNSGSNANEQGTGTHTQRTVVYGQMINDNNANLALLAMGDGAVQFESYGTWTPTGGTEEDYHDGPKTEAWDGDTILPIEPASGSEYYEAAAAGTLPTAVTTDPGEDWISFDTDQAWDCTDDVEVGIVDLPNVNMTDTRAACSAYVMSFDWINCHEIIPEGGGG